jgi:hypothetical protein
MVLAEDFRQIIDVTLDAHHGAMQVLMRLADSSTFAAPASACSKTGLCRLPRWSVGEARAPMEFIDIFVPRDGGVALAPDNSTRH